MLCWWGSACCLQTYHLDRRWPQLHLPAAKQVGSDGKFTQKVQVQDELWEGYYGKSLHVANDQKPEQNHFGTQRFTLSLTALSLCLTQQGTQE